MRWALVASLVAASPAWAVYQCGDTKDDCQCGANNPYPCCSNGGNCTWYAWEAACCSWGVGLPGWGNANQWTGHARANASYAVSSFAVTDAVSCRDVGSYGHVAFVTGLSGANITVREQNCWGNYGMRTSSYAASYFTGGYITRAGRVACRPGDSQTQSCGNCGTQSRGCGSDGAWNAWGACSSQGACRPGAVDESTCGTCGSKERTCSASCQWNAFGACGAAASFDGGTCDAGVGACAVGTLTCTAGSVSCAQTVSPTSEVCDGADNDCDGVVDGAGVCPVDAGSAPGAGTGPPEESGASGERLALSTVSGSCAVGVAPPSVALVLAWLLRRRR